MNSFLVVFRELKLTQTFPVTTLGHYAYIDGGEMSQLGADGTPIKNRASNAGRSLSLDSERPTTHSKTSQ